MRNHNPPILSVWIGSLEAYNAGKLIGQWFDLDYPLTIEDDFEEWKKEKGIDHHEEFEVFDAEVNGGEITECPRISSIAEAIEIAEILEGLQHHQHAIPYALDHRCADAHQTIRNALDRIWEHGETREEIAQEIHGEEVDNLSPTIRSVVCFKAIAEMLESEGSFFKTASGYAYTQD